MNNKELKNWYLNLGDSRKQIFLAFVSNYLTIHGRAFGLDLRAEKQVRAFEGLNELQHQISQHIAQLGLGVDRYPDEVFWNMLREKATAYDLSGHLEESLQRSRKLEIWG